MLSIRDIFLKFQQKSKCVDDSSFVVRTYYVKFKLLNGYVKTHIC